MLEVDAASRVPERWAMLTPFPEHREPGRPQRLYAPRGTRVGVGRRRMRRSAVEGVAVEAVREEWLVEDRWWTPRPLRRHYFELVLADGAT